AAWRATLVLLLRASAGARTIRVIYTRLGIPYRRRTIRVPRRVTSVDVRVMPRREWWSHRHARPHPYCRIELHGEGEPPVLLVERDLPGERGHQRVAARLSALLIEGREEAPGELPKMTSRPPAGRGAPRRRWYLAAFVALVIVYSV